MSVIPARDTYRILARIVDDQFNNLRLLVNEREQIDSALDEIDMLRDENARLKTWIGGSL